MKRTGLFLRIVLPVMLLLLAGCQSNRQEEGRQEEKRQEESKEEKTGQEEEMRLPYFTGVEDLYVVQGSSIDYRAKIRAFDCRGEELTEKVSVDASGVILDQCGEYEVFYEVEDQQGERARAGCKVYVVQGEAALPLILDELEPAFVRIRSEEKDKVLWGSGFILELGEEGISIMTNAHVLGEGEVYVYFSNGSGAGGRILGKQEAPDLAVVQIDKDEIGELRLEELKRVEADLQHWDNLNPDDLPAAGYRCLNPDGTKWIEKTGKLLEKQEWLWAVDYPVVRYTMENERGASGSAVIDQSGKLIAMAFGVSKEGDSTAFWGIGLPDIMSYYEEIRTAALKD